MTNEFEYGLYIADLAAYNAGYLHGVWVNAEDDVEGIEARIQIMLEQSPVEYAEEWAIHDYCGFKGITLSEYEDLNILSDYICFLNEYPDLGAALLNHFNNDLNEAHHAGSELYRGCYRSLADYAEEIMDECYEVPEYLQSYIDYESFGRDMEINGDIFTIENGADIHVFWNA